MCLFVILDCSSNSSPLLPCKDFQKPWKSYACNSQAYNLLKHRWKSQPIWKAKTVFQKQTYDPSEGQFFHNLQPSVAPHSVTNSTCGHSHWLQESCSELEVNNNYANLLYFHLWEILFRRSIFLFLLCRWGNGGDMTGPTWMAEPAEIPLQGKATGYFPACKVFNYPSLVRKHR